MLLIEQSLVMITWQTAKILKRYNEEERKKILALGNDDISKNNKSNESLSERKGN